MHGAAEIACGLDRAATTLAAAAFTGTGEVFSQRGRIERAGGLLCGVTAELVPRGIRVHAISPGPLKTRAASGLKDFDLLLTEAAQRAPLGELVDIMDVGFTCAFLATPYARRLSGETLYVDGGVNIMA